MKKITSIILLLSMLLTVLTLGLCSCDSKKDKDSDKEKEKKEETKISTTLTREQWEAAFSEKQFENFTYKEVAVVKMLGTETVGETIYEFEKSKAKITAVVSGITQSQVVTGDELDMVREGFFDSLLPMVDFDDYTYDEKTKSYVLTGSCTVPSLGAEATSVVIKFENGKVIEMTYACKASQSGFEYEASSTITFTKYGTTKVTD